MEQAKDLQTQQQNIETMQNYAMNLPTTGSGAEWRTELAKQIDTYLPAGVGRTFNSLTGGLINPTKAAVVDAFVKSALTASGTANKAMNPEGGIASAMLYVKNYPGINTRPEAIQEMSNVLRVTAQQGIDWNQNRQQHYERQVEGIPASGKYQSLTSADAAFLRTNPPQVYVGAAAALNDKPYDTWAKGLTKDQLREVARIVWKVNPSFSPLGPDGKTRFPNPALAGQ
jgi:hypothetical protein